jgi:transposase
VVRIGELVMIMELHRQGLSPSAIARQLGIDRRRFANTSPLASSRPATVRDRLGLTRLSRLTRNFGNFAVRQRR